MKQIPDTIMQMIDIIPNFLSKEPNGVSRDFRGPYHTLFLIPTIEKHKHPRIRNISPAKLKPDLTAKTTSNVIRKVKEHLRLLK